MLEKVLESWLMCGVPDGATEEDLAEIADDLDGFIDIMDFFLQKTLDKCGQLC